MAKPLFKNYYYEFDKNETKILLTICNQTIKQMQTDPKYAVELKYYQSIAEKLNTNPSNVKLTKAELDRLTTTLKANIEYLEKQMKKSWFFKRWLYKPLIINYKLLLSKHFEK
jgi:hypothetical protein